jgi:SAM-dependent methyltransferase
MTWIHPRQRFAHTIPAEGAVLDIGCWNYSFARQCDAWTVRNLRHHGVDWQAPAEPPPPGFVFRQADLRREPIPFDGATFDAVVASHVIEHLPSPLTLADEIFRLLKPGGLVYIEAPSERTLWFPGLPFEHDENRSLSFFDDPTHVGRPQTPQSLYRLFRMYEAEVLEVGRVTSRAVQWRLPWLIAKAVATRNAGLLEDAFWRGFGFAVFGVGRASSAGQRRYVLPR